LAELGAWRISLHDEDLVPCGSSAEERDRIVAWLKGALEAVARAGDARPSPTARRARTSRAAPARRIRHLRVSSAVRYLVARERARVFARELAGVERDRQNLGLRDADFDAAAGQPRIERVVKAQVGIGGARA
jgi:hypothetical protein